MISICGIPYQILLRILCSVVVLAREVSTSGTANTPMYHEYTRVTKPDNQVDCTNQIKREALKREAALQLEYENLRGHYMVPGIDVKRILTDSSYKPYIEKLQITGDAMLYNLDKKACWKWIDCGKNVVCLQNMNKKWSKYYLKSFGDKDKISPILDSLEKEDKIIEESKQYHFRFFCPNCDKRKNCYIRDAIAPYKFYATSLKWIYLNGEQISMHK